MNEEQAPYKTGNPEADDAMEMLSKGYAPAVIIKPPTTEIAMGDEPGFIQTKSPAFVKMSTAFKKHMKKLKGARLAIWLYVALSVNEQGNAFPGIGAIMKDTGYSNHEVIDSIKEIEALGYFAVRRRAGHSSLYQVLDFVTIGKGNNPTSEVSAGVKKTTQTSEVSGQSSEENNTYNKSLNKKKKQEINIEQTFKQNSSDSFGAYLDDLKAGQTKNAHYVSVIERLSAGLHINFPHYGENKDIDHVAHMIALAEADHPDQTVERFCEWAIAAKDAKELSWYRIKPAGIWGDWLLPYMPEKNRSKYSGMSSVDKALAELAELTR